MQDIVNPFKTVSHLMATCPLCAASTNFQSAELRIDVGKGVNVSYIPVSHISTLNIYAPYMCEHCAGLFYLTSDAAGSTIEPQIFFGDSTHFSHSDDFDLIYNHVDSNSIFFLRGTFGCGKSHCSMKILRNAPPKIRVSIIEVNDASGYNQSAYDTLKNSKQNEAVALTKLTEALSSKINVIILCGTFCELDSMNNFMTRIEEGALSYGIQVVNLNHNDFICRRQATKQIISDMRAKFEP